jgi:hypothetical protein
MPAVLFLLLIAIAQHAAAPARDVPREKVSAAIAGRVTERGSGRPLPRTVVTLLKPNSSTPLATLTDEDGRYQFSGVEPGAYALSAGLDRHRSTYLPQRYGADTPGLSNLEPQRPNLELKPGETRAGLDFALWRALAIEGRVLDPWEMGMANVPVIVKRVTERVRASAYISTDDRGKYRAYGLAPGRYRVCAEIDQQSDAAAESPRLAATCFPTAVDGANAGEVVLTSDDATGVDVRVQQSRAYSFSLSGSVVDAGGSAVTGAFVGAYPVDDRGPTAWQRTLAGAFVLTGLAPGRYMVRASYGETTPDDPRGNRAQVGYAFADLSAGDAGGLVVPLSNPVDVAGKVTFERERAGIRKAGMVVHTSTLPQRLTFAPSRPPFSSVEDDLSFTLSRVYRLPLIVRMTGLPDGWVLKSVQFDGRDVTYVPTDFAARPDSAGLEIVLTKRVARAVVRVLDEQGTPASSFDVVAVPADPSRWALPFAVVPATREESELTKLGPMLPGDYFVAALSRDDWLWLLRDGGRIDAIASVGTRVTLAEGNTRKLELRLVTLPQ